MTQLRHIWTYHVNNLPEVDGNLAVFKIWILSRVVNESRNLALSHFAGAESKDEEERVNDIRLARTIGPDD